VAYPQTFRPFQLEGICVGPRLQERIHQALLSGTLPPERGLTVNLAKGHVSAHDEERDDWIVHLVDTGNQTQTGGRVKRVAPWLDKETFMMTYGDGVCNVDLRRLVEFHRSHKKLATVTAVRPLPALAD